MRAAPEHVSAYELVVEEGTPFAVADRRGQLVRADADEAADMLESIDGELERAGLVRYELTIVPVSCCTVAVQLGSAVIAVATSLILPVSARVTVPVTTISSVKRIS